VPVGPGVDEGTDDGRRTQAPWVADYDLDACPGVVRADGVEGLRRLVDDAAEPVTVVAVGPTRTPAAAVEREPDLAERCRLVGMHGSFDEGYDGGDPGPEYSVADAPAALRTVLSAPWRDVLLTPLDTCGHVRPTGDRFREVWRATDDPLVRGVVANGRRFAALPPWAGCDEFTRRSSTLHDRVAVSPAREESLVETDRRRFDATDDGYAAADPAGAFEARVALRWRDLDAFEGRPTDSLLGPRWRATGDVAGRRRAGRSRRPSTADRRPPSLTARPRPSPLATSAAATVPAASAGYARVIYPGRIGHAGVIMSVYTRDPTVPLSGEWRFATDPDDVGVDEAWYDPDVALPDARDVDVPHAWQRHDDLREYVGTAWYRRTASVDPDPDPDRRYRLRFGAVDYEATVWVDGVEVGSNRGGYLPFEFDVTDALRDGADGGEGAAGEHVVAVRVRDPEDLREIPHGKQGEPWYTRTSGIWQDVSLVAVPETRVASVRATPDLEADAVRLAVDVAGPDADDCRASVRVAQDGRALGSATLAPTDGTAEAVVALDDPDYWTPESPALCDVAVELLHEDGTVVDDYADYFGMRSVHVADGEWYLNGEPLRVRGALDQAYYPDSHGWPTGPVSYREEIRAAKRLGFNMLRKHIKPAHPEFVELADRTGLLVWQEPANPDRYTERSRREVREQFEAMVERDYNRPSVVVWSLYNEEWGIGLDLQERTEPEHPARLWNDADKQAYLADLYADARELDPTRLVCDNSGWAHVATDVNDYHEYFVLPDRVDAWHDRLDEVVADPAGNYATTDEDGPAPEEVPLVVSEFGTWGFPDVDALVDHYGGDPHWFDHEFLDGLKRPAGVRERFAASHLSDAFDDLGALAADWQRREFESIAEQIADMRVHDDVSGYVVTEFTDIEWEFNGMLDYLRRDKAFADRFAAVNGPTMVRVEPAARSVRAGESIRLDLAVVNDRPEPLEATVEWTVDDASGTVDVAVDAASTTRLADAVEVAAPAVDGVGTVEVAARLAATDAGASWTTSVVVVDEPTPAPPTAATDATARDALAAAGVDPVDAAEADVLVTTAPDGSDLAFAADGGRLVVLPDAGTGRLDGDALAGFDVRDLPAGASWNLCASFLHQRLLDGVDRVPGWAFDGLHPYSYVTDVGGDDAVHAGYTEGWLSATGGVVLTRPRGDGAVTACGLRVTDPDAGPVATALLRRLLVGPADGD
jgi:hypothetical protein